MPDNLETRVAVLEVKMDTMQSDHKEILKAQEKIAEGVQDIKERMAGATGAWKLAMGIGIPTAVGGAIVAIAHKFFGGGTSWTPP